MRPFLLIVCILIGSAGELCAQLYEYERLKCEGEVPDLLLVYASDKARTSAERARQNKDADIKASSSVLTEHSIQNEFFLDQILNSGKVLYGDEVTRYINKVADIILKSDPTLRERMHFYTLRSTVPNAFVTATGDIFVSTGLISILENEAQLAFVLCHEIQHYVQKHSIKAYTRSAESKRRRNRDDFDQALKEQYRFSQDNETEADLLGLELFLESSYATSEAGNSFRQLIKAKEPFLPADLKSSSVLYPGFRFTAKQLRLIDRSMLKNAELDDKEIEENEDQQEYSTHPKLEDRIYELEEKLKSAKAKERSIYQLSQDDFLRMRYLSRMETVYLYMIYLQYGPALYLTTAMEKEYGPRTYTTQFKAQALYGIAVYNSEKSNLEDMGISTKHTEGGWVSWFAGWRALDNHEIPWVAMRELYLMAAANKDPFTEDLRDRIFSNMLAREKISPGTIFILKKNDTANFKGHWRPLGDLVLDSTFRAYIVKLKKNLKNASEKPAQEKLIDDLLFYSPIYSQYDVRKKKKSSKLFSEDEVKRKLYNSLNYCADKLDMNIKTIGGGSRPDNTTEAINQHIIMNDWLLEMSAALNMTDNRWTPSDTTEIQPNMITSGPVKANAGPYKYTGLIIVEYEVDRRALDPLAVLGFCLGPVAWPLILVYQFSPQKEQKYLTMVWDIQTGSLQYAKSTYFSAGMQTQMINSHMYDMLYRIHHRSYKK